MKKKKRSLDHGMYLSLGTLESYTIQNSYIKGKLHKKFCRWEGEKRLSRIMSWSVHELEENFQSRGRMRREQSLLEWEMLLKQWAGSRERQHFCGLVANFSSLKTKTIPAGGLGQDATGQVFSPNMESGSWLVQVFSSELAPHIRWPKYWSLSLNISPSNDYLGLISIRIDWFDFLAVQELSRVFSSTTVLKHQFFGTQPFLWFNSHIHT